MKQRTPLRMVTPLLFLAAWLLFGSAVAVDDAAGPEQAADRFHEALTAGNSEAVLALLDPAVRIFESGGVEKSRDEYASHHMISDMKFMANMQRELVSREVVAEGGLAVISTQSVLEGTYNDNPLALNSTETLVLKLTEQGWLIQHVHWSSKSRKKD